MVGGTHNSNGGFGKISPREGCKDVSLIVFSTPSPLSRRNPALKIVRGGVLSFVLYEFIGSRYVGPLELGTYSYLLEVWGRVRPDLYTGTGSYVFIIVTLYLPTAVYLVCTS